MRLTSLLQRTRRGSIQSGLTRVIQNENEPGAWKRQVLFFVLKVWVRDSGNFCGASKAPKPPTKQTFSEFSFLVTEISEEMSLPTVAQKEMTKTKEKSNRPAECQHQPLLPLPSRTSGGRDLLAASPGSPPLVEASCDCDCTQRRVAQLVGSTQWFTLTLLPSS